MKIALVQDNIIKEIKTVSSEEEVIEYSKHYQNVIDITDMIPQPAEGYVFNGNSFTTDQPYSGDMRITKLALRNRFTFTELCNIQAAAKTDIQVETLKENLMVATYIDLARADTVAALNLLVYKGLITSDRANTILTTIPNRLEVYLGV